LHHVLCVCGRENVCFDTKINNNKTYAYGKHMIVTLFLDCCIKDAIVTGSEFLGLGTAVGSIIDFLNELT
jgi:hypothetical protein